MIADYEIKKLLKMLSDCINISDRLGLEYGDGLREIITEIKERYEIED